ncbi:class A beta-lactamase [Marisediminicola senii]|uniref:class A beta-lactamase n=1 Tax=Marisediminicola senii TaxID=2711233 RepID=UPI0013ED7C95|nr:class A beta-lactamase [Marisediminicola senii]
MPVVLGRSTRTIALVALAGAVLVGCGSASTAGNAGATTGPSAAASTTAPAPVDFIAEFDELEARYDATLGVFAVDTGTGVEVEWRADDRFAYASTIKALAAAAALGRFGIDGMQQPVAIASSDLVSYSPVTETRVGGSMTLAEIADAAVTLSDNTAGNYLFEALGGPGELDRALAVLGDDTTTVSRIEPQLNEAAPGDERDTSTPRAMAGSLREYVLGDALPEAERAQLTEWLVASQTGGSLVGADLPGDWTIGDKSGAGGFGTRNDIAVVWPSTGEAIVIAVMSTRGVEGAEYDDRLVAEAAAIAVGAL